MIRPVARGVSVASAAANCRRCSTKSGLGCKLAIERRGFWKDRRPTAFDPLQTFPAVCAPRSRVGSRRGPGFE